MEFNQAENHFGSLDYIAVIATLVLTAMIGVFFSRKNKTNDDLLLGGRKINHWPVALSVMASYVSAVTVVGLPSEVFGHGIEIFNMAIIGLIGFPISVAIFVPFLYSMKLTSVFEYLELRFQSTSLRKVTCGIYIFEQIALAGVILYGPSLVLVTFLGIPTWVSIFGIGFLCTVYTCVGGIGAVVWTDALQAIIMLLGMIAIAAKAFYNSGGFSNAFEVALENGRLDLLKFNVDPFERHNFFNFYIGFVFITLFRSTIHQQQVQRLSSQPSLTDARKAMLMSVPITLSVHVVAVLTGLAVFAIYYNCDPVKLGKIKTSDHLIPYFVVTEMSTTPGALGLFVACIFSGVMSSISSTLNSLTAVTWEDFLSPMPRFAKMNAKTQANVSRVTGVVYGFLCVLLGFSVQYMGASVYAASYQVAGASSGAVTAVFICGFFLRKVNATGAKYGAITGFTAVLVIGIRSLFSKNLKTALLPTSTENCTAENFLMMNNNANFTLNLISAADQIDVTWPEKLFKLSYLMYPLTGTIITLIVATLISFCSGGFRNTNSVPTQYLHPYVRPSSLPKMKANGDLTEKNTSTRL